MLEIFEIHRVGYTLSRCHLKLVERYLECAHCEADRCDICTDLSSAPLERCWSNAVEVPLPAGRCGSGFAAES